MTKSMSQYNNHFASLNKFHTSYHLLESSSELSVLLTEVIDAYEDCHKLTLDPEIHENLNIKYIDLIKNIDAKLGVLKFREYNDIVSSIVAKAKDLAEKAMMKEQSQLEMKLRLQPGREAIYINELLKDLNTKYSELAYWEVEQDRPLKYKVKRELKQRKILDEDTVSKLQKHSIVEKLTSILSETYLTKFKIDLLRNILEIYIKGTNLINEKPTLVESIAATSKTDHSKTKFSKEAKSNTDIDKSSKVRIWHRALLYCIICRIDIKNDAKEIIKQKRYQEYGCVNGGSFYTEVMRIVKYKQKLDLYILEQHPNPIHLKEYKTIIRSLPQYTKKVEKLLNDLPETIITK